MTLTFGLNLPYVEGSMDGGTPRWADILAMATTAESIGFDAVWISDHLGFGDPHGEWQRRVGVVDAAVRAGGRDHRASGWGPT